VWGTTTRAIAGGPMTKTFCDRPFSRIKVTSEGWVSTCCFQDRKCLGNILHTSLEEMWNSELAKEIREVTSTGTLHKTCQIHSCPFFHIKKQTMFPIQLSEFPINLELDLPNQHCNIGGENPTDEAPACLMCERHLLWVKQEDRLSEICERLRPYVTYLKILHIQGVAESFWKDRIFDVLEWLNLLPGQNQVIVSTTTNSTILNEPRRKRFLRYPKSHLVFSLDAATPETYRIIRRVDMFHRVKENLLAYSRERNSPNQHLSIHNNINLININEVVGMVELAALAGCPIDFNPTYSAPSICVDEHNASLFKKAQDDILETAAKLSVKVTFMRPLTLDFDGSVPVDKNRFLSIEELTESAKVLGMSPDVLKKYVPSELKFQLPLL
jgi:MoaA/NifB/PqqE/SkfB family radical SAM enzyme